MAKHAKVKGVRISTIIILTMLLALALIGLQDPAAVIPFACCAFAVALPLLLVPKFHPCRYFLIFTSGTLCIVYMMRPLVLLDSPEQFVFARTRAATAASVRDTLYTLFLLIASFQAGIYIPFALGLINGNVRRSRGWPSPQLHSSSLVSNAVHWLWLAWGSLIVASGLAMLYGVGLKSEGSSALGYLTRLNPSTCTVFAAAVLLFKYRSILSRGCVIGLTSVLTAYGLFGILRGSKGGLAILLFSWCVVELLRVNDFSIRARNAVLIALAVFISLFVGFPLAKAIRFTSNVPEAMKSFEANFGISESLDLVTRRTGLGFDGQIIVDSYKPAGIVRAFRPYNVLMNCVARLVPGTAAPYMTTGKAVGLYYVGFDENHAYAGGIGIFGSLSLMFGRHAIWAAFATGLLITMFFSWIRSDRDPDRSAVLQLAFLHAVVVAIIGGNLGGVTASLIIVFAHTYVLFKLFTVTTVSIATPCASTLRL